MNIVAKALSEGGGAVDPRAIHVHGELGEGCRRLARPPVSGAAVAGAIVNLEGGRPELTRAGTRSHLETDIHGEFRVSGLSSGAFRLVIGRPGFATEVREEGDCSP